MKSQINKDRLIDTFLNLVKIDSPSGFEEEVANFLVNLLSKHYKNVKRDKAGNVILKTQGKGEALLLSAHMDTVEPGRGIKSIIRNGIIQSSGNTILGMDNKSGIALIVEVLLSLHENKINHIPLDVIFTTNEEIGCLGASQVDYHQIRAKKGLTFDYYSYPIGTIINRSFYYVKLDIEVFGKESHAGNVFENHHKDNHGINAITIASEAINKFKKRLLTKNTSLNFGTISGGMVRNSVPGKVSIQAELRSFSKEEILFFADEIKIVFEDKAKKAGGTAIVNLENSVKGYHIDHRKSEFLKSIGSHFEKNNIQVQYAHGGSDANIFNEKGIETLDLSVGGYGEHTLQEQISIEDLYKITHLVYSFLVK